MLAALIKQPEPSATHKGFDPAINPTDAQDRWDYVHQQHDRGGLAGVRQAAATHRVSAKTIKSPKKSGSGSTSASTRPYGNVINYVRDEMREMNLCTDRRSRSTEPSRCARRR